MTLLDMMKDFWLSPNTPSPTLPDKLTAAERERLALLTEECGEVVQVVSKIMRHGYESYHPQDGNRVPNRYNLEKEISHLLLAVDLMIENSDLDFYKIEKLKKHKQLTLNLWLHHNQKKTYKE